MLGADDDVVTGLGSTVGAAHVVLAVGFGAVVLTVLASSVAAILGRPDRVIMDRLVLAAIVLGAAETVAGLLVLALSGPPPDALHFAYAAVAVALLPVVRYAARHVPPRRLAIFLGIASVALLGVVARLWTTG